MNISIFSPLSGSPYIELSGRLRKSIGGLINIKNNDNKCFFRFLIRYLNALKIYPERIAKADENMVTDLDCKGIEFPVPRKHFGKIEKNNNISINVFCYDSDLVYPVYVSYVSDRKFKNCMDLLVLTDECGSLYFDIKGFNRFMYNKVRCKIKIHFCRHCLQCFSSERVW